MNITEAKAEIRNLVNRYHVVTYVPEGFTPPVIIVRDGSPYLVAGRVFGEYELALDLVVVGPATTNKSASEYLDKAVMAVLPELQEAYGVTSVEPDLFTEDGLLYPAVVISITTNIQF